MEVLERQILELVAMDRIEIPISSLSGKLKRQKPKLAGDIDLSDYKGKYSGERCYARVESEDLQKARGMKDGIEEFSKRHPKYGAELQALIEEKRDERETHLYFGLNEGCRLTEADYVGVMKSLGYTEAAAQNIYPALMETSRAISRKRDEERRILVG